MEQAIPVARIQLIQIGAESESEWPEQLLRVMERQVQQHTLCVYLLTTVDPLGIFDSWGVNPDEYLHYAPRMVQAWYHSKREELEETRKTLIEALKEMFGEDISHCRAESFETLADLMLMHMK